VRTEEDWEQGSEEEEGEAQGEERAEPRSWLVLRRILS
jgi:hypothetical protein